MTKYIIAIVVVLLIGGCDSRETRLQSFLLQGNLSLKEGDDEKALYFYIEALKVDGCFADALNNAGTIDHNAGRYADAIARYSKAVECNPKFLNAWFNRANTYYESGEYYSALSDLDHIVKVKPDTSEVHFLRGLVQTKLKDYPAAIGSFQRALELNPANESDCRVNLASVKIFMKQYDEAKTELEACLKLNDKEPNIYNSLALIAIEKNDLNEALKQVNKALELSPKQPYFINNRGFIYLGLGELDKAEADINESITLDAWAYRNKGILAFEKKDFVTAERFLRKSIDMDKDIDKAADYLLKLKVKSE